MRRTIAFAVVTVTMIVAVAIGGALLLVNGGAKTTAWVATGDLPAGTTIESSSVHQVQVPVGTDSLTMMTTSPAGKQLAHDVSTGDALRPDDFVTSAMVQVPVSFKLAPGLVANDTVDIYAVGGDSTDATVSAAQGTLLIARDISVVSVGDPTVISVPASQEALWVTLASSSVTLVASRSTGVNVPGADHAYTADEVIDLLAQLASAGNGDTGRDAPSSPAPSSAEPAASAGAP
jgi:hypothetical protein